MHKGSTLGDDRVRVIGDVDTLTVEVDAVVAVGGAVIDETDRGFGYVEGVAEDESTSLVLEFDGTKAHDIDGNTSKSFDSMGRKSEMLGEI
jgi:hypothetical protein